MICEICGTSDTERQVRKIRGMCLCSKHITQLYRHGHFLDKTIYDSNDYEIFDDHAEIILRDKNSVEVGRALIDLEDVDRCRQYKWHLRKGLNTNYVIATINEHEKIHLHRFILNYDGNDDVDHIEHNGLDNRKSKLRIVSHSKNLQNQTNGRKGIKQVQSGRFQAVITKDGVGNYLGTFDTYAEAMEARTVAEGYF